MNNVTSKLKSITENRRGKIHEYLDKKFARNICRLLYFFGLGDCFYEPMRHPVIPSRLYFLISTFTHVYSVCSISGELLGFLRDDLTAREKSDLMFYCIAHPTIYIKLLILIAQKDNIKMILKKLIEDMRIPSVSHFDKEAVRKSKIYISILCITMLFCLSFTTVNAVLHHLKVGVPIRTLVTVWPKTADQGILATISRVLVQAFWWYFITIMCLIDSLCLTGLVLLGYRFRHLQVYFEQLKSMVSDENRDKPREKIEDDYKDALLTGIKMHNETLWCARTLQSSIGHIYSTQVAQSILLLAGSLIKLVRYERSLPTLLESLSFLIGMATITACYMMPCGDITTEASLVSTSVYKSGWEFCSAKRKLRPLVVLAIQNGARPVIMTAFGMYDLSYSNLISVIRLSYSFFAIMY